jgi:hypothetical protein
METGAEAPITIYAAVVERLFFVARFLSGWGLFLNPQNGRWTIFSKMGLREDGTMRRS